MRAFRPHAKPQLPFLGSIVIGDIELTVGYALLPTGFSSAQSIGISFWPFASAILVLKSSDASKGSKVGLGSRLLDALSIPLIVGRLFDDRHAFVLLRRPFRWVADRKEAARRRPALGCGQISACWPDEQRP